MNKIELKYPQFFDVKLPRWYQITSYVVRLGGFIIFLFCAWKMIHRAPSDSLWPIAGFVAGIFLLVIPSLPKAYIEQRNRLKGLKDGTWQQYLDEKHNGPSL